ncbi:MAG: alpha-L-fucosidase [Muribaculaceae bacterium]|nr:alpha-L-fucosidase [Muribaculaceae bacterium]
MKHLLKFIAPLCLSAVFAGDSMAAETEPDRDYIYVPSEEVRQSQKEFASDRFGIFIHWGIYSMFGQGEWYLNYGPDAREYAKAARGFYPADFNAAEWVDAIKDSGARYVTFTSRHHDGFSMFDTAQSDYDIVDATPFNRDVLKELADECHKKDISLHLYYSHLDWTRPDYPQGRTGHTTGRDSTVNDWNSYYKFMNAQLTELLTNYGPVRAIWFDGWWDHDEDKVPFDWQLRDQYAMIHSLQPSCMVANNHHQTPYPGEDIQIFERDLPGENTAGLSGQDVSRLPLETCNTMNGMWGYKVVDTNYKDTPTLIRYLVKAAGMGANLLLNIGPQPNGELPATALQRLRDIGKWMRIYGETIYGTEAGPFPPQPWGSATQKDKTLYVHVTSAPSSDILLPADLKVKSAVAFVDRTPVRFSKSKEGVALHLDKVPDDVDYVIELKLK